MSIADKLSTVAENVPKVFEAGTASQIDYFWDVFQLKGTRKGYSFAFKTGWRDDIYCPKYPLVCNGANTATSMFSYSSISDTLVPITISGNNASVFYGASTVTIRKIILEGSIPQMGDWFDQCTKLENIEFEGEIKTSTRFAHSNKLTVQSIVNIVEHLSASVTNQSVSFSSVAIESANWAETEYDSWDALVATKTNWTFTVS